MKPFVSVVFLVTFLAFSEQSSVSLTDRLEESAGNGNRSASRTPPAGYQYFAGVGSYKFVDQWVTFENAVIYCENEGAHLAIINSPEEAHALVNVMLPHFKPGQGWPRLGFGDFFKKGNFRTIFGKSIASTGYTNWAVNEPSLSNERNCGCMNIEGELGAQCCDCNRWFICEYE